MREERRFTIEAPELLTRRERARDVLFTGLMWFLYVYLWLPAISLAAWLLGLNFAYGVLVRAGGIAALERVLVWYVIALVIIVTIVLAWSASERLRFRDRHRRQSHPPVADAAMLGFFGIDEKMLAGLRSGRCLQLGFDDNGRLSAAAVTVPATSDGAPAGAASADGQPRARNLPETG